MKPKYSLTNFLNFLATKSPLWNGGNASGWREDILRVSGYDNNMLYGKEDTELGKRLLNSGLKSKLIRYSAITFHLEHKRTYKNLEIMEKNKMRCEEVERLGIMETESGIK